MVLVQYLKNGALPQRFLECLPTICPFCGAPTQINAALTELTCTNTNCTSKLSERMVAMFSDLGVKNMGSSKCQSFINYYDITSPYAIFEFSKTDGTAKDVLFEGCSKEFSDSIADQVNRNRAKALWEYVRVGNFPGIRDSAQKLFGTYSSIEAFYADMENPQTGGINFIATKLGIQNDGSYADLNSDLSQLSIKAVEVFRTLTAIKDELCYYQQFFNMVSTQRSIDICISTGVGAPYKSKTDFVKCMNSKHGQDVYINFLSSVTQNCDALIWSKTGGATSKVTKATKYGLPILTGKAFDLAMTCIRKGMPMQQCLRKVATVEDERLKTGNTADITEAEILN